MKNILSKPFALILSFTLVFSTFIPVFGSAPLNDYKTNWAHEAIASAIAEGFVTGYPDGSFRPEQAITRAEYFALINNAFKTTSMSDVKYTDVSGNAWYAPVVAKASAYTKGYPNGSINPEGKISRQEAAVIFSRIKSLTPISNTLSYTDKSAIADWSKSSIIAVKEAGIMIGYLDGSFKPENQIKRSEAVFAVSNSLKYKPIVINPVIAPISMLSVDRENMTLSAGGATGKIIIKITPENATNKDVNWVSSDTTVATVAGGVVTPLAIGTATITATAASDNRKTAITKLTVIAAGLPLVPPVIAPVVPPITPPVVKPAGNPVNLGLAGDYVILTKTGISSVPNSVITGNIGVSPIDSTGITGFSMTADPSNQFSISSQLTGKAYASDYAVPTPGNLTTAVSNMEAAYTDAAGRAADYTELYSGDISGKTLTSGVYKWGTGVRINSDVTLNGSANDVWIFQVAEGVTQANGVRIILTGGAQAKNVFWQVAETVSIGTGSHFEGIVLSMTNISLGTNSSIIGRLLAQTAVTLDATTVTAP